MRLKLCGENITDEDMLEETFTTFHASNMVLQQQYKAHQYTKYYDLIACLLVAKKNNELLMKNHQAHPTGTKPIFEANAVSHDREGNYENGRGRGHNRGRTIIQEEDIIRIIITDLVVDIKITKRRKMRTNITLKKTLVINVECLVIFGDNVVLPDIVLICFRHS